jgi:hypothetical protein
MSHTTHMAAFTAALAALMAGGCATVEPQIAEWTPAPMGSSWEVAQRNTGSYGRDVKFKVTRGDGTWQGAPAVAMKTSLGGTLLMRPSDGKWLGMLGPDGKPVVSFDPPTGWEFPLKVGKSWSNRHRMTQLATGAVAEFDLSCKVLDFEKVTVPAGTFDAFRINCKSSAGSDDIYWSSPTVQPFVKTRLQRSAGAPQGAGTQEAELVSVPSR